MSELDKYSKLNTIHKNAKLTPVVERQLPQQYMEGLFIEPSIFAELQAASIEAARFPPQLVFLVGPVGVGKSTSIRYLGNRLAETEPDIDLIFVDLFATGHWPVPLSDVAKLREYVLAVLTEEAHERLLGDDAARRKFCEALTEEAGFDPKLDPDGKRLESWMERNRLAVLRLVLSTAQTSGSRCPLFAIDNLDAIQWIHQVDLMTSVLEILTVVGASAILTARPTALKKTQLTMRLPQILGMKCLSLEPPDLRGYLKASLHSEDFRERATAILAERVASMKVGKHAFIPTLAGPNVRHALSLTDRVLVSPHLKRATASKPASLSDAEILQACMLGTHSVFTSEDLGMLNVLNCSESCSPELAMLGFYLLSAYSAPRFADEVAHGLEALGIPEQETRSAIRVFEIWGLLDAIHENRPVKLTETGELYREVIRNPVYLMLAAQDTLLPTPLVRAMKPGEVLPLDGDDQRILAGLFDHLHSAHTRLLMRNTDTRLPDWLECVTPDLAHIRNSAIHSLNRLAEIGATQEVQLVIDDAHVNPGVVATLLSSLVRLAGVRRRELELSYVSSGSFIGKLQGPASAISEIVAIVRSLAGAVKRFQLLEETRDVLKAQRDAILAEAELNHARAAKTRVAGFIELLVALRETDASHIEQAQDVLLSKLSSGEVAVPERD